MTAGAEAGTLAQTQAYEVAAQNVLRHCVEALEEQRLGGAMDQPPTDWEGQSCAALVPGLPHLDSGRVRSVVRLRPETLAGYAITVTTAQGNTLTWPAHPTPRPTRAEEPGLTLATDAAGWFARVLGVLFTVGLGWLCAFWSGLRNMAWLGWLGLLASLGLPVFLLLLTSGGADFVFPPELVWWPLVVLLGAVCFTLPRSLHFGATEPLWQRFGVGLLAMFILPLFGLSIAAHIESSSFDRQFGLGRLVTTPVAALILSVAVLRNRRSLPV
ncbi:hypothetical protein [Deinococcus carri]|uniref:hypothetical protein n=1 Tax=Deinococcus carri TaxID=1211323 RepID=UPI0031EC9192